MDKLEKMLAALRKELDELDGAEVPMRSLIVGLVMRGQITRERAEEWARDNGEQPFEERPDPAKFNPMDTTEWTLVMAVAWIIWRTPEAVRDAWEDYLSECWVWLPYSETEAWEKEPRLRKVVGGYELKQLIPPHPSNLLLPTAHVGSKLEVSVPDAQRQLMAALRKGDYLKAYSGRDPNPIPDREWEVLSPFKPVLFGRIRRINHDVVFNDNGVPQFKRVRVKSTDVMRLWLPLSTTAGAPAEESAAAEVEHVPGPSPELSLQDHLNSLAKGLQPGLKLETGRKQQKRQSEFGQALSDAAGHRVTRAQRREAERHYPHRRHRGRPE